MKLFKKQPSVRTLTEAQRQQLIEAGKDDINELIEHYGVDKQSVYSLRYYQAKNSSENSQSGTPKLASQLNNEAKMEIVMAQGDLQEVADKHGITLQSVYSLRREHKKKQKEQVKAERESQSYTTHLTFGQIELRLECQTGVGLAGIQVDENNITIKVTKQ